MRVELHNQQGVVGEITLSADGVALPSNETAHQTIEETVVIAPGPKRMQPEDGEEYLRALAVSLSGSYFWAELIE